MSIWQRRLVALVLAISLAGCPGFGWAAELDSRLDELQYDAELHYNKEEKIETMAGQVYTIINTVKLENRSARSIYNISLDVPLADADGVAWQEVLGEEFSPAPLSVSIDDDGRRVAHYVIAELKSGEQMELVQRVAVRNFYISFDVSAMSAGELTGNFAAYLEPSEDINFEAAEIVEFARDACDTTANPYLQARLLFAAVNSYLTYDNSDFESHSALAAFQRGRGNCEDYANLYAALLRAEGIPARVVGGYLYGREAQTDKSYLSANGHINADKIRHSWVLFYIEGVGWLPADPTFSYTANGEEGVVDWGRFAKISDGNRLVYTGNYHADHNRISYAYQGAAPLISYNSELALYSLISPFGDIVNHWAKDAVLSLYYHQPVIVTGQREGYFGVNESLTRAEMVTILNRVMDSVSPLNDSELVEPDYSDLTSAHWAYDEMARAVARGIIGGYPDGTMRPNALVSRAEAAVMLARVIGVADEAAAENYSDIGEFGWSKAAIGGLYDSALMRGVSAGSFAPGKTMTRGEGATVVARWLMSESFRQNYLDY